MIQHHRDVNDRTEKLRRTGSPACAGDDNPSVEWQTMLHLPSAAGEEGGGNWNTEPIGADPDPGTAPPPPLTARIALISRSDIPLW